jgi:ATP-dependent Clp protease ATP-binding subunit ClpC
MKEVSERLGERKVKVMLTQAARNWLANEGYDPSFGARPLQRALQKHVESPLSVRLLTGEFSEGDTILVDVDELEEKLVFLPAGENITSEIKEKVKTN